ncbi:sigma-70 family RNA polymerase sigma factor [Niabella sp. CC-SYL272]|uniref:RNA polymerase sigma factor n=1 Tax=Niabella agricola TaxID=2891571 RepID=UPI001F40B7A3|nr:sigma-70 family RNA polymerase sigma factor [Niabella agricola]MCF3112237.1 sigma-70 family RNA polymerase sigma factor [Niabella agricola]
MVTHTLADRLFREQSGIITAVLVNRFGAAHLDTVLDAVQDAFEAALRRWRFSGIPDNPAAWLMTVARNNAINRINRDKKQCSDHQLISTQEYVMADPALPDVFVQDSQLRLLLICCHPELSEKSRVMITLAVLCGFGTVEIAGALLMQKEAVKKSLTRAKAVLRNAGRLFEMPLVESFVAHRSTIHTVLYLLFNEGYKTTRGTSGISKEFCFEAMRLTKIVYDHDTGNKEAAALLALQFFNAARFPARISPDGEWMTLEEQDRSVWNEVLIREGFHYLHKQQRSLNRYYLEALIASIHCTARFFSETNWPQIAVLYQALEQLVPGSNVIALNQIIAESYAGAATQELLDRLETLRPLMADGKGFEWNMARAHLLCKMGAGDARNDALQQALEYVRTTADRQLVLRKLEERCPPF